MLAQIDKKDYENSARATDPLLILDFGMRPALARNYDL
jgi:hypothetical protein